MIIGVTERGENFVGGQARSPFPYCLFNFYAVRLHLFLGDPDETCAVSNFLAKIVSFAEDFAADANDVIRVGVVFGEDKGFGDVRAAGKKVGEKFIAECGENRPNLVGGDDGAIKIACFIGQIFIQLFPTDLAGLAVPFIHVEAGIHF